MRRQIDSLSNENGKYYGGKYENGKLIFFNEKLNQINATANRFFVE